MAQKLTDILSPPSTKTPLTENDQKTLNHNWQRWFNDLYSALKQQDTNITSAVATVQGGGGSGSGKTGPQGPQGPAGSQGSAGQPGSSGSPGAQGARGLDVNVLADGGFSNSVYLTSQNLDGGGAI